MTDGTRRMAPGSVTRRGAVALLGGVALGAATLGIDASALDTASLERA